MLVSRLVLHCKACHHLERFQYPCRYPIQHPHSKLLDLLKSNGFGLHSISASPSQARIMLSSRTVPPVKNKLKKPKTKTRESYFLNTILNFFSLLTQRSAFYLVFDFIWTSQSVSPLLFPYNPLPSIFSLFSI